MKLNGSSRIVVAIVAAVLMCGCAPSMPDDLQGLIVLMNSNSEVTAVAAANKVSNKYGRDGMLKAFRSGGGGARSLAPRWLAKHPDAAVEAALVSVIGDRSEQDSVRISALWALQDIGTSKALPAVTAVINDPDPSVSGMAKSAAAAIWSRIKWQ